MLREWLYTASSRCIGKYIPQVPRDFPHSNECCAGLSQGFSSSSYLYCTSVGGQGSVMLWEKESIKLKFVSTATPGTVALSQPLNPCCKKRPDTCHRFKRSYISQSLDRSRYIAIISDLFRRGILKKPKISVESELPKLPLLECMQADCTRSEAIFWKVFTAGRQGSFVTIQT